LIQEYEEHKSPNDSQDLISDVPLSINTIPFTEISKAKVL